jgi:hypothetical protein
MTATQRGHTPRIVAGVDGSPRPGAELRWAAGRGRLVMRGEEKASA